MSAPRLSASAKRQIVQAYAAGVRVKDIAARFGVHESYPGVLAKRRDVKAPSEPRTIKISMSQRTKLTPYLVAKALDAYQRGKDIPEIASMLRCSFPLAARALAEAVEAERYQAARSDR